MTKETKELLSAPINQLRHAIATQTQSIDKQTSEIEAAIKAAAKVGPWAKAAVIIAGVAVALEVYKVLILPH